MLCFVPVLHGCVICLLLCREEGSSPVSLQLLRGGIWAVYGTLVCLFVGFWDRDYVSNLHMRGIKVLLRAVSTYW